MDHSKCSPLILKTSITKLSEGKGVITKIDFSLQKSRKETRIKNSNNRPANARVTYSHFTEVDNDVHEANDIYTLIFARKI